MNETKASSTSQPITEDQDLAQVLAANNPDGGGLKFEASPLPAVSPTPAINAAQTTKDEESSLAAALDEAVHSLPEPAASPVAESLETPEPVASAVAEPPAEHGSPHTGSPELDEIKKGALEELRPLVGKLDLKPDEKFDTLLLIIRSTDDKSLLAPAYEAAKGIEDDTKRAQALLDVIKEVDYFGSQTAA